jgi:hypothetical protein
VTLNGTNGMGRFLAALGFSSGDTNMRPPCRSQTNPDRAVYVGSQGVPVGSGFADAVKVDLADFR